MGIQERLNKIRGNLTSLMGSKVLTLTLEGPNISILSMQDRTVLKWLSMPFNPRLLGASGVQDPQSLANVIKTAVARAGGTNGKVLAAYPSARLTARALSLPPVRGLKPHNVIPREARRLMGTAVDYHHLFWEPLESFEGGNTYYLLAVPRNEMNSYMQSLLLSGLRPKMVESRALALSRAVGTSEGVIVYLGPYSIEVLVVNRFVALVTTQRSYELILGLEELITEIVDLVQQAITFYDERSLGVPLPNTAPLFLCGKHNQIDTPLLGSLEAALKRPAQLPEPSISSPPEFPVLEYMVNIGLALGEF